MAQTNWTTWVLLVGLLWLSPISTRNQKENPSEKIQKCFNQGHDQTNLIVPDNFNGFIRSLLPQSFPTSEEDCHSIGMQIPHQDINHWIQNFTSKLHCIIFLQSGTLQRLSKWNWPRIDSTPDSLLLYISKWHTKKTRHLCVLNGTDVKASTVDEMMKTKSGGNSGESSQFRCFWTNTVCENVIYDEDFCKKNEGLPVKNRYMLNLTGTQPVCHNCRYPVRGPEDTITLAPQENVEEELEAVKAVNIMNEMVKLSTQINATSAACSTGGGDTGILLTQTEDVEEVSFAYTSPNDSINIIEERSYLNAFARSVTVPKEAFEKVVSMNMSVPFAALFRFNNMSRDALDSNVLGNEVLAVEMGAAIANLTDKISIIFRNITYKGIPTCHSWNGEGKRPKWTDDGCETIKKEDRISCRCSHLTFFAILLSPLNQTISSHDLKTLTMISQIGCGLSMFFLSVAMFMHFLIRKTKANKSTRILIQLMVAMLLLNFTFLINHFIADLKSSVGCKTIAALMHYFMLVTFTWFTVQALHLCLQLWGKISIRHYILKVSITSWALPCVVGIVLLSIGTYGEQIIHTDNSDDNVAMCWITETNVHYIVNIGYYALVFLFTFITLVIILTWLVCLRKIKAGNGQINRNGRRIITVVGLCYMLGVTWGFAFFSYGVLQIPSFYIFTILNSLQGLFLSIYYHKTSRSGEMSDGMKASGTSTTLKTILDTSENPYTIEPNNTLDGEQEA